MKAPACMVGLLLIGAAIFFLLNWGTDSTSEAEDASRTALISPRSHAGFSGAKDHRIKPQPVKSASSTRAASDSSQRLARVASKVTPELQRELVDVRMRDRKKPYDALFESWQLDAETAAKVMAIISDRETRLVEIRQQYFQTGTQAAASSTKKNAVEHEFAELQLIPLVGPERYEQMARLESELQAGQQARITQRYSKSNN